MRYVITILLLALTAPVWGYNETVNAISYNPSRLGTYKYLKVAKELVLPGGLVIDNPHNHAELHLYAQNGGTVTFQDELHTCSSTACTTKTQIENIIPNAVLGSGNACSPANLLYQFACYSAPTSADFSSALVHQDGNGSYLSNYTDLRTTPTTVALTNVNIYGGTLQASDPSYIGSVSGANNLTVTVSGTLHANIVNVLNSLELGNVTISQPNCGSGSSKCTRYTWVERIDDNNTKVTVLAVVP